MKYSLIILILVISVLAYADSNNDLDKPATVTSGGTLKISKSSDSLYMENWTISKIVSCLIGSAGSSSYYVDGYHTWYSNSSVGQKLAQDLTKYKETFPACTKLFNDTFTAGTTSIFDSYAGEPREGDVSENGLSCHRTDQGNTILDASRALSTTVYTMAHTAHSAEELVIHTSSAKYVVYSCDPIVLDLDGDGKLEASNGNYLPHSLCVPESELVAFDMNADGFEELVEWVGANDGLLVHDITNNEVSGKNLFGDINGFKDGFEQLATLDTNKDGALTGEELAGLSVWQDKNRNAKIDAGEIHSLESLGITKLNVKAIELKATFERNGKYYMMWDWNPVVIMVKKNR